MTREQNTVVRRLKAGVVQFSIASAVVLSQVNIGVAQADWADKEVAKFNPLAGSPLLADSRRDDRDGRDGRDGREGRNGKQPRNQRQFSSNEGRQRGRSADNRGDDKRRDQRTHKSRDHRDFRTRDEPDRRTKVWRTKEKDRRYFNPPPPKTRHYSPYRAYPRHHPHRDRVVVRPFRHHYPYRLGHHHHNDLWGWLAFTAITLTILDNLNDQQQREHDLAIYNATSVPLGETIYWRDGSASGSVTPIQEGTSSAGRYCREFRHEVAIGGNIESLYGTACQNDDGSWEIVQ